MKDSGVGLFSIVCTGYFVLMQAINLSTLNAEANADSTKPADVKQVLVKPEVTPKVLAANIGTNTLAVDVSPQTIEESEVEIVARLQCWALGDINIYAEPNESGAVVGKIFYRDSVICSEFTEDWLSVEEGYIKVQDITFSEPIYRSVFIPKQNRDFKSYMDYRTITSWLQKDLQDIAETGTYGCRMVEDRYCVAVGTACDVIVGDYIDLVLENGTIIPAIVGDIKADIHTQDNNLVTAANGCCSEFIVDMDSMDSYVKRTGSVSNNCDEWKSPVVEIRVLGGGIFR